MAKALLITQCLQRDFVGPIGRHDAPPSRLHVGHAEAERMLGREPESGALAQLMSFVRSLPESAIDVLHVRDWHDDSTPAQRAHLEAFGRHCIAGSEGAELVLDLQAGMRANESFVDALHLNDFVETNLQERLEAMKTKDPDLRVAVIGVWTDAKVSFLCYELRTRLGLSHVATCSALTASASREKHFVALDSLETLLGVTVTHSPSELAEFLVPDVAFRADGSVRASSAGHGPKVFLEEGELRADDADAVAWLYRESRELSLHPLTGGFSGAAVYSVDAKDALGHQQAPTVLKVAPRELISKERVAFERVESVLGNDVPRLLAAAEFGDRGALKFSFATMGRGRVRTLKGLYEAGLDLAGWTRILDEVFGEVLARFADAACYEPCPLLDHYGFKPSHAESVARNVAAIVGDDATEGASLVAFYREVLPTLTTTREHHYVGYVHGDLNGANVLLDGRDNVWIIDFAHTARRHAINDLVKLENDLLFLFQRLDSDAALEDARRVLDVLADVADLGKPLPETVSGVSDPEVLRAYAAVRVLRGHVKRYCREDAHPLQWSVAALRYSAHTLSFDEADARQRRLALYASTLHADRVARGYRERGPLEVGWLDRELAHAKHAVGITLCPGRRDRGRDLERDLEALVEAGVGTLVCLLPDEELRWADVTDLPTRARSHGLRFLELAIPDQDVPTVADASALLDAIEGALADAKVVVHCMGGLGRSGTVVACLLRRAGLDAAAAIRAVRRARGPRCIENVTQERFVEAFLA